MARPKTIAQAADNLRQAAPLISQRYTVGIQNADWQGPASSEQAEQNYGVGVQRAIAQGSRRDGILAVTNQQWQSAAITKGATIIGQRIIDSLDKYIRNFSPILAAMTTAQQGLPARTSSATANINNRLIPIVRAAVEASGKTFG